MTDQIATFDAADASRATVNIRRRRPAGATDMPQPDPGRASGLATRGRANSDQHDGRGDGTQQRADHEGHNESEKEGDNDDNSKKDDKGGKDKSEKDKPKSRWPLIVIAVVAVLAIIAGVIYWFVTRDLVSTDDAYTEGNAISIAPKISGYVIERLVDDNTPVRAGDLMLRIDPRDYVTARDQAQANLDLARQQLASAKVDLQTTLVKAPANLQQAEAQLAQSRANAINAKRQFERQRTVDPRATTQTNVDQADTTLISNNASVKSAEAQVATAGLIKESIESAEDTIKQRQAQVEQTEAALAQDELNLSYTEIRAPQDGRVTRRNIDVGTYAQAGQQAFYLVAPQVWIVANFKETQLARMRPGQPVKVRVDAYPRLRLDGHVDSIQDGSGARFSTFPAENATGNFVKIVRRVPVKILIDRGLAPNMLLPLGLSVDPTVNVE